MTVSKALRDKSDVSSATKERLRALARQMGYVPNVSAQQLRSGQTRLFGLVISASTNPVTARLLLAMEEKAHEMGYEILLIQTLNRPEREESALRRLMQRRVDGIFLTPVYRRETRVPIYEELQQRGIPVILLGAPAPFCDTFVSVDSDDVAASAAATQHLIQLGHRRIAYFAGPLISPSGQDRLAGYRRALREADLPVEDALVFNAGTTLEEGSAAATQFLSEQTGATAIQCSHDLVAIGAANMLFQQGYRVPEDISITGFGNILAAEYFRVPLTTVRQPKFRLGDVAVEMMSRLLRGEAVPSQRLPAPLEVRASTAAPRG